MGVGVYISIRSINQIILIRAFFPFVDTMAPVGASWRDDAYERKFKLI